MRVVLVPELPSLGVSGLRTTVGHDHWRRAMYEHEELNGLWLAWWRAFRELENAQEQADTARLPDCWQRVVRRQRGSAR